MDQALLAVDLLDQDSFQFQAGWPPLPEQVSMLRLLVYMQLKTFTSNNNKNETQQQNTTNHQYLYLLLYKINHLGLQQSWIPNLITNAVSFDHWESLY